MCLQLPEQWEQVDVRVQRPASTPQEHAPFCDGREDQDDQSVSLPPGSR